jgi:HSP20 family protein
MIGRAADSMRLEMPRDARICGRLEPAGRGAGRKREQRGDRGLPLKTAGAASSVEHRGTVPPTKSSEGETMTTLSPFYAYARRAPLNGAVIDSLFDEFFRAPAARAAAVRAIPFEVTEQGGSYVVTADLPGFAKEDIAIEIEGARVTITAERKTERALGEGERVLYSERNVGRATRSFELASEIDQANANARYADGVLVLTLPKKVVESRKLLQVQ